MNSDNIFFFGGHGYEGKMVFVTSQNNINGITAQNSGNTLNSLSYSNIHDMAFAMFQSCLSANTNTANNYGNLQYELYNRGVDSSIGWNSIIYYPQTVCWNDGFWNKAVSGGYTIDACGWAGSDRVNQYFPGDPAGTNGWCMKGDRSQTLNPAQVGD